MLEKKIMLSLELIVMKRTKLQEPYNLLINVLIKDSYLLFGQGLLTPIIPYTYIYQEKYHTTNIYVYIYISRHLYTNVSRHRSNLPV